MCICIRTVYTFKPPPSFFLRIPIWSYISEELHHSITEGKKSHDQTTTMLQQKMDKLKKDLQKQTEDFEDAKNQHRSALEKLNETNNELNMKLEHLADSLVR